MNTGKYAVEVRSLTVAYGEKPVLWNINLAIPSGNLVAIVGPNGAGKTTLIRAMLGLLTPVSGTVYFPGEAKKAKKRFKHTIGYVPQSESVDWDFPITALDVVQMGCYGRLGWIRRPKNADRALALLMLEKVGMKDCAAYQIGQLSGGQRQRVFLARALMQKADIYFMDEPFKGVDAQTEKSIVALLKELRETGKTVIVVHHDLQTIADYFDWMTLINLRIVASGPVADVLCEENLRLAYRSKIPLLGGVL